MPKHDNIGGVCCGFWVTFMLDAGLLVFFAIGAVLGYLRGALAGVVLLIATYVPFFVFIYFYDFISAFLSDILANSQDGTTAALGGIGAFSGIIAFCGFMGAVFVGTRLILKILQADHLDRAEKIAGAIVGVIGQNIVATLAFFLIYTAMPTKTTQLVYGSLWMDALRPLHKAVYPTYLSVLEKRTQKLSLSIAQQGLGATFVGGISLAGVNENLGFDAPDLDAATQALQALSRNLNLDEISRLLNSADAQTISPEAVDRMIQEEQASRLREFRRQLQ